VEAAVRTAMEAQGSFVAENNVVSQSVPHLHVHVVPRRPKDGLRGFFWPRTRYASAAEAATVAAGIRSRIV
jgi:histidine triad (HIT) family protein